MIEKKSNRVAIVGCADSRTHVRRLYKDIDDYEVWGLNQLFVLMPEIVPKATRWFQIHHEDRFLEGDHKTMDWMKKQTFPIYMRENQAKDYPSGIPYPKHEIIERFGKFFSSQIAWMVALAIYEEFEEIHLYGIHMATSDEYHLQKDGVEYYVGMARGKGIKVFIPPTCDLLKTTFLYGFEDPSPLYLKIMADLKEYGFKIRDNNLKREKNRDERNQIWGALNIDCSDEEKREAANERVKTLIGLDQMTRDKTNQLIGYRMALDYIKTNWMFKLQGGQEYESETKELSEDRNDSGD